MVLDWYSKAIADVGNYPNTKLFLAILFAISTSNNAHIIALHIAYKYCCILPGFQSINKNRNPYEHYLLQNFNIHIGHFK